jgi:hypothetical protein
MCALHHVQNSIFYLPTLLASDWESDVVDVDTLELAVEYVAVFAEFETVKGEVVIPAAAIITPVITSLKISGEMLSLI